VSYEQFDALFLASARQVHTPDPVPYADLWRAAQLGFNEALGRSTLDHHDWLVFLNRLWDAHRTDGLPDGPVRVPQRIWDVAERQDETGQLHRDLLAATGLRTPEDFGQQLAFHLSLWEQESLVEVLRGAIGVTADGSVVHADGPVTVDVTTIPTGFRVEVQPELAGSYTVTLHWPDRTQSHDTPELAPGQLYGFELPAQGTPPQSVTITRRKRDDLA
jgi:hypothetical protein